MSKSIAETTPVYVNTGRISCGVPVLKTTWPGTYSVVRVDGDRVVGNGIAHVDYEQARAEADAENRVCNAREPFTVRAIVMRDSE